ncbi:hypothetical protein [Streptomyces sp. NPDC101132]|uniref:hypothetical protein n=1 Tax=Streptomyces sp. NPDC101132 TaxID=3366110 RepID=UPI0038283BA8
MGKKRAFGVLAATLVAAALPIVAAPPASASSFDCMGYLRNLGYTVGPKVKAACDIGADDNISGLDNVICQLHLENIGVRRAHAYTACYQLA